MISTPREETRDANGLPFPYSIKRDGLTITNCDSEPVQTPGCIQPHGVLLALRLTDLTILQVSENCADWLGARPADLLGQPVSAVLGENQAIELHEFLAREPVENNPLYAFTITIEGSARPEALDASVHTSNGIVLLELERTDRSAAAEVDYYSLVKRSVARLQSAATLAEFCQVTAEEVRSLTGLDRVMVYYFHPDDSGEVLADARRSDLNSWLGLRYPADDIPKPAREIFKRIGIRPLPDASAEPAEMVPLVNPDTGRPLNMTHCSLRGASAMYTEYLRNMDVAASLTMPILREGELWGLIACHHYTPHPFPFQIRAASELMAQIASLQLKRAEDQEFLEYRGQVDAVHFSVLARAAQGNDLAAMMDESPSLSDGIEASGVALLQNNRWVTAGQTIPEAKLNDLAAWLRAQPEMNTAARPCFATDCLSKCYEPAEAYADIASGLLAVPLSQGHRSMIVWFRPEQIQTFNWGGNPYAKPTVAGKHGPRLTPRASFDLWQEQVRHRSVPWKPVEVELALKLRLLIMDLVVSRTEQIAELNNELARSNEELDAFAYIASHDLKEPLRGIHRYARYLKEEAVAGRALSEQATERLDGLLRLTSRMDGLLDALLQFARAGHLTTERELCDLGDLVREAMEMLGARLEESGVEIRIPRAMPTVNCDREQTREIFLNLIANAIKYNLAAEKWVEIGYAAPDELSHLTLNGDVDETAMSNAARRQTILYVRDNGIGIERRHYERVFQIFRRLHPQDSFGGGSGAGLAIARKIVTQHKGEIWLDSVPGKGTVFFFTLGTAIS